VIREITRVVPAACGVLFIAALYEHPAP